MPTFRYQAKTGPGAAENGTIQAENIESAAKKLRQDGRFIVSLEPALESPGGASVSVSSPASGGFFLHRRPDISAFTRQLASLVRSGFPLTTAINTLAAQEQQPAFKSILAHIHERIQKGQTFSDSLAAYPQLFSGFYISLVRIGESSGKLDETLERLAEFKEKEDELRSQVRSALTYPAFLVCVGAATLFILLAFFIPRLAGIFSDMGQKLPLATIVVMQLGSFCAQYWYLIVGGLGLAVFALRSQYHNEKTRVSLDHFILNVPGARDVVLKTETSRFCYALAMLLKNGGSMLEALGVVALSVDNRYLRRQLSTFQEKISKGASLSSCLAGEKLFPVVLTNMVAVGEESGTITDMLFRIGQTLETEVNRNLKTVVSLLEPVLILCIGGLVVLMVAAILLPIFQLDLFS